MLGGSIFADVHVELSDLVGVHARSWHFDGTSPVEIVVAEIKGELLNDVLLHGRVIVGDVEVSWQHASLGSVLRNKIEVVFHIRILVLNYLVVDAASGWWILEVSVLIFHEESLSDSLVHNDHSDVGL